MRPRLTLLASALVLFCNACSEGGPSPSSSFIYVTAGAFHTCALTGDHLAWCWGRNLYGALGDGSTTPRDVPVLVAGNIRFDSLSAGFDYTCGLTSAGTAWCWGENLGGQLGDGTMLNRPRPVRVLAPEKLRSISAGEAHTCANGVSGATYCWGAPLSIEGDNVTLPRVESGPAFPSVSSGYEIACGIAAGGAPWCWGLLVPGVPFADTTQLSTETPALVAANGVTFVTIGAGTKHACALTADGAAYCWGMNVVGQVGDGTRDYAASAHAVLGGHRFAQLSAHSPAHACALTASGEAWCWGANTLGALGTGAIGISTSPVAVAGGLSFRMIATGFSHSCGVTNRGELYCWGYNGDGQLGTGDSTMVTMPAIVAIPAR